MTESPKSFRLRRYAKICLIIVLAGLAVETTLQIAYRAVFGYWRLANLNNPSLVLFQWHPYLVGSLKPGASFLKRHVPVFSRDTKADLTYTNNSWGCRGADFSPAKAPGTKRIVTLGGSSTYCLGVSDSETWPYLLGKKLGPGWEVINLGVPGYSTVENLIQTALWLSDLNPDYAIYYEGWNDARNAHVQDLKPDYANFHGATQFRSLNLDAWKFGEWSVMLFCVKSGLRRLMVENPQVDPAPDAAALTARVDERALALYGRNLNSIIALCKSQQITPIMLPQVLNLSQLTDSKPNGYMPFVRNKDIKFLMSVYNAKMREIAAGQQVPFVEELLQTEFDQNDFWDQGHLSKSGDEKISRVLADFIRTKVIGPANPAAP